MNLFVLIIGALWWAIHIILPVVLLIMLPMVIKEIICWAREIWTYIKEERKMRR